MNREDRHLHLCESYSSVAVEGACDRFCGRPLRANPYNPASAFEQFGAWEFGWHEGDFFLNERAQQECSRWLREAA